MNCKDKKCNKYGMTLVEMMVVLTIMSILMWASIPIFRTTLEQSRVDVASSNLQSIWTAQRLYWAQNRTFAEELKQLENNGLLDPGFIARNNKKGAPFSYDVDSATDRGFDVSAVRQNSSWIGTLEINEKGFVIGEIRGYDGTVVTPSNF